MGNKLANSPDRMDNPGKAVSTGQSGQQGQPGNKASKGKAGRAGSPVTAMVARPDRIPAMRPSAAVGR